MTRQTYERAPRLTKLATAHISKGEYVNTWDVGQVLDHIKALGDNCHMSLSTLTQKTAMLMAFCTAGRGSELRAANIETFFR